MKKILIVDDSQVMLRLGELMLSRSGYVVVTAGTGKAGVERAFQELPDLILMDFNLPDYNGCEARAILAEDLRTRSIPVVIVTTNGGAPQMDPSADLLLKPFDHASLLAKVREYVPLARRVSSRSH
jgi:CheY-like chemotaxis protein